MPLLMSYKDGPTSPFSKGPIDSAVSLLFVLYRESEREERAEGGEIRGCGGGCEWRCP
jgi:hypothetical protein